MKINSNFLIIFLWLILGVLYLEYFVNPYLLGLIDFNIYGGDNFTYAEFSKIDFIDLIINPIEFRNLSGMALFSKFTFLFGDYYIYITLIVNLIIMHLALNNFRYILSKLNIHRYSLFNLLMAFNFYIVTFLCSINKELIGILILSYSAKFLLNKKYFYYISLVVFSFYIRDAYAFFLIMLGLIVNFKIPKFIYILFVCIVVFYATPDRQINILLEGQDDKSLGFMVWLANIQSYPFGYIITFIPKLILNLIGPLSPYRFFDIFSNGNIIGISSLLSSIWTLILLAYILFNDNIINRTKNKLVGLIIFLFLFISCAPIFINYRYIFPVYPFICVYFLSIFNK